MMRRKVVILTEIIAPYRIPVFNALAGHLDVDLHVIFLAETDDILRKWRVYKNEIHFSYEVLPSWRWRAGKRNLLLNRRLKSALQAANPQTIVCGGYNYPASWAALWWARRQNVRFILWIESNLHDQRAATPGIEWLKRYFMSSCDAFVVPGKSSSAYVRTFGVREQVIFTAQNAVDNTFFSAQAEKVRRDPASFREKFGLPPRFILFVGRFVPEKGVFDLVDAYAKLSDKVRSEVAVVFAGDGVCAEELAARAKGISPGAVCFQGFVQREDLAGMYALAEMLVLPTHSDPWGLVVNEAMASGLPIVVTNVAGCSDDLVEDGWNGYVVPTHDAQKLSVAIGTLLERPDLRKTMAARSLERIQNYSPEICAEGMVRAAISATLEVR
jgi:1,2-diacylglycerol 3-alpha-glucosyltransferase